MSLSFQTMYKLLQRDPRYKYEAYHFVREALAFAQENMLFANDTEPAGPENDDESRDLPAIRKLPSAESEIAPQSRVGTHITGQQLCEACRLYGLQQYGYLAVMVLESWGVRTTSDFGSIVYNLIEIEQMRKSESDRREDFDNVYSFDTAFEPQFELAKS